MSSTSNIPFNDPTIQAIENAIHNADKKVCQKADLYNFDPWAQGDTLTPSSHDLCQGFFDREIGGIAHQIPGNLDESDLVSFASTRGWLFGYSCAQNKALPVISAKDTDIENQNTVIENQNDEIRRLERELENIRNTPQGRLFRGRRRARCWCGVLGLIAAVAIVVIIINWPI